MAIGLKFQIQIEEGWYYPCSENKGADQLRGYREADLHLCFQICKIPVFSRRGSNNTSSFYMSSIIRKPAFCICENQAVDQLHGNSPADQRLCFHYISHPFLNLKFQASSHLLWQYSLVCVGPGQKPCRHVFS